MNIRIFLFFCLLTVSFCGTSTAQQASINAFVQTKGMGAGNYGVNLVDVKSKASIASYNKDKALTPASTMKLVTTATALELYGPDYKIPTQLQYSGFINSNGVLIGDIYIKGGGDPTLGSEHIDRDKDDFFYACIDAVQKAGIKEIDGRIIADETCFDAEGISGKWLWEDLGSYFAAGAYGISIYDNTYRVYFKSGKTGEKPQILKTVPYMGEIGFYNYLESGNKDSAYIYGIPYSNERWLRGSVPANKELFLKGDIPEPAYHSASCLKDMLEEGGIHVTGAALSCRIMTIRGEYFSTERVPLLTYYSPPLSEIIRDTNVRSNNHYAEHLFKLIALTKYSQASFSKATEVVEAFWKERGIDFSGVSIYDGSGLAPTNRLTPHLLTDILVYMTDRSKYADAFYASLPIAGKEGTVRGFLKGTSLEGEVHLKSGSITNVQCYAGYFDKDGKRYAFSIMANDYGIGRQSVKNAMGKMMLGWQ